MSDDTAYTTGSARREMTLNFGDGHSLTIAMPDQGWQDAAMWAGDLGDDNASLCLDGWETRQMCQFLACIVDELRMDGLL